jgi:hypothetical protein
MKQETYRIEIKGSLDADWLQWFEGFSLTVTPEGNTRICVRVVDQPALHGLLAKIRNLNLVLLSINHLNDDETV